MQIEYILLICAILVLASVGFTKISDNLGVPTLILFLGVGMLAGSEGPGGLYFDDAGIAQFIGIVALTFILFAGGMDTQWSEVRPVARQALSLATLGVLLTALVVGTLASWILDIPLISGLLLGAVVSSTDAAAVFSVLRSKNVSLKTPLKPLLELESGSNDPMAVFLTIGLIHWQTNAESSVVSIVWLFVVQMGLGSVSGWLFGKALIFSLNRLKLSYDGIYPVFTLAVVAFIYATTSALGGSGFLAVYLAGLFAGRGHFIQKKSLLRFFDAMAWLSQIAMFVTLGLLVFPSQLFPVIGVGLLISALLVVIARPFSVFLSLSATAMDWRSKTFISWVGLRGAVPIILATFPLIAKVEYAELIFNLVFFIVITSALIQGWSIPYVARLLKVDAPTKVKRKYPIEFAPVEGVDTELVELIVPYHSSAVGKSVVELNFPGDALIVLISRDDNFLVPSAGTLLNGGDVVLVLVNQKNLPVVRAILGHQVTEPLPS